MVISETIFKNNEIPVNSSLFVFKRGENICMDTHYVYDEFKGTDGQGNNTNYHKYIKPMIESFGLVNEYYYMLVDDVPTWIDMTKRKRDIDMGESYYSYDTLIGDPDVINVELLSKYAIAYFTNTEEGKVELKEKYVVDPKKMTFSFIYQKSLEDSTESFNVDFISKYHLEKKTNSIRLNSMTEIPEYEPYYDEFRNGQITLSNDEKLKYYIEYMPTVIYPDNFGGPNEFVVTNPGRDTLAVFIPNRYDAELTDPDTGTYKYISNIDLFAEENKFLVFLNGVLVDYTVIDTDPGFADIVTGETRYKRIRIENCGQLLRKKRLSSFTDDGTEIVTTIRDDTINIVYWDDVKYMVVNRDEGFSIYNHKLYLFKDRPVSEGGPVIMAVPSIFYYTDSANSETFPIKITADNCIVVRDGLILTPEVDFSIDNTRLILKSELEVPELDRYLTEAFYDVTTTGKHIYDYNRYRNLLTDKIESYTRTKVLYFYNTESNLPVILNRDSGSVKVNNPLIGNLLVKNWDKNDLFIGGNTKMDLEYVTTEPDGVVSLDENSDYYGQKRTVLDVVMNDTVVSGMEDATLDDSADQVAEATNLKEFEINLPESYLSFEAADKIDIHDNVVTLGVLFKRLFVNRVSSESFDVESGSASVKYCVMYLDGTKSKKYTQSVVKLRRIDGSHEIDVSEGENLFDIVDASNIDSIYVMMSSHDLSRSINPDPNTEHINRFRMLFCLLKTGELCLILPTATITVSGDTCTASITPYIDFFNEGEYIGNFWVENDGSLFAVVSGAEDASSFHIKHVGIKLVETGSDVETVMSPTNDDCIINKITITYSDFKDQIEEKYGMYDDGDELYFDIVPRSNFDNKHNTHSVATKLRFNPIQMFLKDNERRYLFALPNCQVVKRDITSALTNMTRIMSFFVEIKSDGSVVIAQYLETGENIVGEQNPPYYQKRLGCVIVYFDIILNAARDEFTVFVDSVGDRLEHPDFTNVDTSYKPMLTGVEFQYDATSYHKTYIYTVGGTGSYYIPIAVLTNSLGIEKYEGDNRRAKFSKHSIDKSMTLEDVPDGSVEKIFNDRVSLIINSNDQSSNPRLSGDYFYRSGSNKYGSVDGLKFHSISQSYGSYNFEWTDMGDPDALFSRMSPLTHIRTEGLINVFNNITLTRTDSSYFRQGVCRAYEEDEIDMSNTQLFQKFKMWLTSTDTSFYMGSLQLAVSSNDVSYGDTVHITQYELVDDGFKLIHDIDRTITNREFGCFGYLQTFEKRAAAVMSVDEFDERFSEFNDVSDDEFLKKYLNIFKKITEEEKDTYNITQMLYYTMNFEECDKSLIDRVNSIKNYKIPFGMNDKWFLELYDRKVYLVSGPSPSYKTFLFDTDMFDKWYDFSYFYENLRYKVVDGNPAYAFMGDGNVDSYHIELSRAILRPLSQQNKMLFLANYHNGYKLVLIDPANIQKTGYQYIMSVKKSVKDYDPFRETSIYRLKLFV